MASNPATSIFIGAASGGAKPQQLELKRANRHGLIAGAIGWHLIATRSRNATRLLRTLVPTVLVLSLIPDVLLLAADSVPGTTTAGVVALMLMHFGVAAAAVPAYRRLTPPQS